VQRDLRENDACVALAGHLTTGKGHMTVSMSSCACVFSNIAVVL